MKFGFYFDQSRCTGCYTCNIACRDRHDIQDCSVHWRKITQKEWGKYPNVHLSYISLSCSHCENPVCAQACPADAISKREKDGIMVVDREACLGAESCGMQCREACPYDVPQFNKEGDDKMQMCTLCVEKVEKGKKPVCVDACPMRALDFGALDKLKKKYGKITSTDGFTYSPETKPSIVIKRRY